MAGLMLAGWQRLRAALLMAALLALAACSGGEPQPLRLHGSTMGTSYSVTLVRPPAELLQTTVAEAVQGILDDIDAEMSTYRRNSVVSQFNRAQGGDWFPVSARLVAIVDQSRRVSEMTGGAFDITVGSLVDLWGFGADVVPPTVPSTAAVGERRKQIGFAHLQTRSDPPALRKTAAGLHIDLSAIAKGYAVDQVADYLASQGVDNYLVEVGGELRVAGSNPRGGAWRVAVERPVNDVPDALAVLEVSDTAIATSGDYRNYFEQDGRRYSHEIDPATGEPIRHQLVSVTVINPRAALADALATGLLVLGPQAGYRVAESEGLAVLFIERQDDKLTPRWTPAFMAVVQDVEGL